MNDEKQKEIQKSLAVRFSDFPAESYSFTCDAVTYTVKDIARRPDHAGKRHVTGRELIEGALDFACKRYDFLAPEVFRSWGLRQGKDLGLLVYRLIQAKLLAASKNDKIEDFDTGDDLICRLTARLERPYLMEPHIAARKLDV